MVVGSRTQDRPVQSSGRKKPGENAASTVIHKVQQKRLGAVVNKQNWLKVKIRAGVYDVIDAPQVVTLKVKGQFAVRTGVGPESLHHLEVLSSCNTNHSYGSHSGEM